MLKSGSVSSCPAPARAPFFFLPILFCCWFLLGSMKQLPGAGRGGMPVLPLKTALALADHVRDVPIFLQIGSYTASLGLGFCLGKKKINLGAFPPLVPTPEDGTCLTRTKTSWNRQASSSPACTCTCDHVRKVKLPPCWSAHGESVCTPARQAGTGRVISARALWQLESTTEQKHS